MEVSQILVNLIGIGLIGWIVWYFWLYQPPGEMVAEVGGVQQVTIRVKGGYSPDTIVVRLGKPVRLNFHREETSLCSEMVIFDKLRQSARLPQGEVVAIEFTPQEVGEIPFQCQMGMLRGKVVVEG